MKVKVKGLVFAGFAAAVFAQSAMATDPAPGDLKTVTSKAYVDSKFDGTAGQVIIQGANRGDTNYKTIQDSADYVNDGTGTYASGGANEAYTGAGALVSGKAVKQAIDNAVSNAVTGLSAGVASTNSSGDYLNFTENNGAFEVGLDNAPVTTAAGLTGYDSTSQLGTTLSTGTTALVTAGAVNGLIDGETALNTSTLGSGSTNATVPTSKNVYDFVTSQVGGAAYQPVITNNSSSSAVQIGYKADGSNATWGSLSGTDYLAVSGSGGVYTIDIDDSRIATSGLVSESTTSKLVTAGAVQGLLERESAGTTTIDNTASNDAFPSSKNVYDFVNTNYQAKAATGTAVRVGYNGGWATLAGDSSYISVADDNGTPKVSLTNVAGVGNGNSSTIATATGTNLPTVANVKAYVDEQIAALPTSEELPTACSNGTSYCALVAYYDADTANGGGNAGVRYEWTVMAPTGN